MCNRSVTVKPYLLTATEVMWVKSALETELDALEGTVEHEVDLNELRQKKESIREVLTLRGKFI